MKSQANPDRAILVTLAIAVVVGIALVVATQPPAGGGPCPGGQCPDGRCPDGTCPADVRMDVSQLRIPGTEFPPEIRTKNYKGGSCVHASMITLLNYHGLDAWADWWHQRYAYAESGQGLIRKADAAGLKFAYEDRGDVAFLDWCSRTRRGAVILFFSRHSVNFVRFDGGDAVLLDNNRTGRYIRIPRDEFVRRWRGYGGFALTLAYPTAAPQPRTAPNV